MSQERLPTLSMLCSESDKLGKQIFYEFLVDFTMKKARTKPF